MNAVERELYRTGDWKVVGGRIVLTVNARLMAENGEIDYSPDGEYYLYDADYVIRQVENPKPESITVTFLGPEPDFGREMLSINYETFYEYNHQTVLMDDYFEMVDEINAATSDNINGS
jgi:hypothetical protein